MVNSIFESIVAEDSDFDFNLKNLKDQSLVEQFETKFQDFSPADPFLDFDSINWFEEKSVQEMDVSKDNNFGVGNRTSERIEQGMNERIQDQTIIDGCQVNVGESVPLVKTERDECEKLESLIEQEMGRVSLVCGDESSVVLNREGENEKTLDDEDGESSEHESDNQPLSSSYKSDPTVTGTGEDKNGNDDEVEEDMKEQKERHKMVELGKQRKSEDLDMEFEEGEIRDSNVSGSKMIAWTGSDDEDEDDDDNKDDDVEDEIYDVNNDDVERRQIRSNNEIKFLPPVPPVDVMLHPHHEMVPVGVVLSVISAQVIVEATEKHNPLNEGSILWITNSRSPLGQVDEIFGPVKLPYYIVRYNSDAEVPTEVNEGTPVSFVPNFVNHVLNEKDLYKKGYDASGENDEEVSDDGEFSDDEKEEQIKRLRKLAKRNVRDNKLENNKVKAVRDRNWKQCQPLSQKDGLALRKQDQDTCIPGPSVSAGKVASLSAPGHGLSGGTAFPQQFAPTNTGLSRPPNAFSADSMLPQQLSQNAFLANGFPTGGTQLYPNQMPVTGMQFNQQVNPIQNLVSAVISSLNQQNTTAGSMYPQGLVGQNQTNFGMSLPVTSFHPLMNPQGLVGQNQMNFGMDLPVASSHPLMNPLGLVGRNQANFGTGLPIATSHSLMIPHGLVSPNQMSLGTGLPVASSQPLMDGGGQGLIPNVGLPSQNQMNFEVGFRNSCPVMYPQGIVGQNQMNYGMHLPIASSQPLMNGGKQGLVSNRGFTGENQMNFEAGFQSSRPTMNVGEQGVLTNGRLVGQNQMNFQVGFQCSQPLNNGGPQRMTLHTSHGQGIASNGVPFIKDNNLQGNASGNAPAPQQFNMGASTSQRRKPFQHRGGSTTGRRGWRKPNHDH